MRTARLLCLLLAIGLPAAAIAGDIQITCEPGLHVYLDGNLVGTSKASEDGLYLVNIPEGRHIVRVEKPGCFPQGFEVNVTKLPIQVKVAKWVQVLGGLPGVKAPAQTQVDEPVGKLVITSAPQACTVTIDGTSQEKDVPYLTIGALPQGKHTISFSRPGVTPLSTVVDMEPGTDMTVRGDFLDGKVEVTYEGLGSIRILSTPQSCMVYFLGETRQKTTPIMNISHLPAGRHRLIVAWGGREMTTEVLITNRYRTIVTVDFGDKNPPFAFAYEPE